MYFYVRIKRLNGRQDHVALAEWVNSSGVGEVDYNEGGWADAMIRNVDPHLRFDREDDAIAYILAHGGEILKKIPEQAVYPGG